MTGADVVIVGGGVMGASVAWHLARRGLHDVVVLDAGWAPGAGSTSRATGGYRAQYGSAINVRLSLLSRDKLRAFADEVGRDSGYLPAGYLWLAQDQAQLAKLETTLGVQRAAGLAEARMLSPRKIAEVNPAVALDDIVGAAFCPTDGFIRPLEILNGYLDGARQMGVRIVWGAEVRGFGFDAHERIVTVETSQGRLSAGRVVNAAGPWAGEIAKLAGVDLPVWPLRRQVAATVPTDALPADMPMTIFCGDGFHLRVRDRRVLLLWPIAGVEGAPFDTRVEDSWIAEVVAKAHRHIPVLRHVAIDRAACWGGLYEMSPDKHAVLGPALECENFYLINGSSGHGVMHAPALGQLLAEILLDGRATALDATALRPTRFLENDLNPAMGLL